MLDLTRPADESSADDDLRYLIYSAHDT